MKLLFHGGCHRLTRPSYVGAEALMRMSVFRCCGSSVSPLEDGEIAEELNDEEESMGCSTSKTSPLSTLSCRGVDGFDI